MSKLKEAIDAAKSANEQMQGKILQKKVEMVEMSMQYEDEFDHKYQNVVLPTFEKLVKHFEEADNTIEAKILDRSTSETLLPKVQTAIKDLFFVKINAKQSFGIYVNPIETGNEHTGLLQVHTIDINGGERSPQLYPLAKFDAAYLEEFIINSFMYRAYPNYKK